MYRIHTRPSSTRRLIAVSRLLCAYYCTRQTHQCRCTMCAPPNGIVSHGNFRQFARRPDVRLRRAKVAHTRRRNTFSVCNSERRRAGEVRAVFSMPARGRFASSCELGNRRALLTFTVYIYIHTRSHLRCSFTLHLINFYAPLNCSNGEQLIT